MANIHLLWEQTTADNLGTLALSPRGDRLGLTHGGQHARQVEVLDVDSGRRLRLLENSYPFRTLTRGVASYEDGRRLTQQDWDDEPAWVVLGRPLDLAWSPDGSTLAVGYSRGTSDAEHGFFGPFGNLQFWDMASGEPVDSFLFVEYPVSKLAFSPDGKRIAAGADSLCGAPCALVRIYDLRAREKAVAFYYDAEVGGELQWSSNNRDIALAGWPDDGHDDQVASRSNVVSVIDHTDERAWWYRGHALPVHAMAWCPGAPLVASVDEWGEIHVWHARGDGEAVAKLPAHQPCPCQGLAWSGGAEEPSLIWVDPLNCGIRSWQVHSGSQQFAAFPGLVACDPWRVQAVSWSADLSRLALLEQSGSGARVSVWTRS